MTTSARGPVFWAPRVLTILFALFLSVFAFDVFTGAESVPMEVLAFLIHLTPVFLVLAFLALAWKWELVGVVAYAVLGVAYIILMWGRFPPYVYVLMAGPAFLLSILFLLSWRQHRARTAGGAGHGGTGPASGSAGPVAGASGPGPGRRAAGA